MRVELHPDFRLALNADLPGKTLESFVKQLEGLVRQVAGQKKAWSIGTTELKLLVRRHCRRYDEATGDGTFAEGRYFPLFTSLYADTMPDRQLLLQALEALHELSEDLDDPVSAATATSSRIIRTWSRMSRTDTPLDPTPATQLMLWRVFESIVKGEVEVVEVQWGERVRHFPRFASAVDLVRRRGDARRAEVLANLKFTLGCASLRRPPLVKLLERDENLSTEHRQVLITAVGSRDPNVAEPISALLRHHVELIALAGYDRLELFADLVLDFVTHLRGDVLAVGRGPDNAAMIGYLRIMQDRYLPGLFNYARILRKARQGSPFLGDLLHESYLVRTHSFDGDQEPPFARMLQDWTVAQRVIQTRAGYKSIKGFSFAQAYLEEAAPVPVPARAESSGRTRPGMPVKELGEFETFIELPSQGEGVAPAEAAFDESDVDDAAETTPYQRVHSAELRITSPSPDGAAALPPIGGPPPSGPVVIPVRLGSMDQLYSAPTEILPILTDDAMELHSAVTDILPTNADGSVDLQRVATQLFPTLPGNNT